MHQSNTCQDLRAGAPRFAPPALPFLHGVRDQLGRRGRAAAPDLLMRGRAGRGGRREAAESGAGEQGAFGRAPGAQSSLPARWGRG